MNIIIHDVSNYLYGIRSKSKKIVGGLPMDGVEKLLYRLTDYPLHHHILVFDRESKGLSGDMDTEGYKGTRDGKPFEIRRLEELLKAFAEEIRVAVVVASGDAEEADDLIYTLAKRCAANKYSTMVFSDDIDMAACVINKHVSVHAVSQPKPDITIDNYNSAAARKLVPHNMIAFHVATSGKPSDNIKPMNAPDKLMLELYKVIYSYSQGTNLFLKGKAAHASEYDFFIEFVDLCDGLSDEDRAELKLRAKHVCCSDTGMQLPELRLPRISKVYGMLRAIGSLLKSRDGNICLETTESVETWLGDTPHASTTDDVLDMSAYTLNMSEVFGGDN